MALLALDERRIAARRLDVAPCLRLPASAFGSENDAAANASADVADAGLDASTGTASTSAAVVLVDANGMVEVRPSAAPVDGSRAGTSLGTSLGEADAAGSGENGAREEGRGAAADAAVRAGDGGGGPGAGPAVGADTAEEERARVVAGAGVHLDGVQGAAPMARGAAGRGRGRGEEEKQEKEVLAGRKAAAACGAAGSREGSGLPGDGRGAPRGLSHALQAFMAERYAPWLLRPRVQAGVLAVFLAALLASLAALPHVSKCAPHPCCQVAEVCLMDPARMAWFVLQRVQAAGMFIELAMQRGPAESACRSADHDPSLLLASVAVLHTALNARCATGAVKVKNCKGRDSGPRTRSAASQHEQCAL